MPTSPGWPPGFVPSAAQWAAAFAGKVDYYPLGTAYGITTDTAPSSSYAGSFFFALAPLQFTLPPAGYIPSNLGFTVNALGGAVSFVLNSTTDSLQTVTGGSFVLPMGNWAEFVTDGVGSWWYNQSTSVNYNNSAFTLLQSSMGGTFSLPYQPGTFLSWSGAFAGTAILPGMYTKDDVYVVQNTAGTAPLTAQAADVGGTIAGEPSVVLINPNDTVRVISDGAGSWLAW